MSQLNQDFEGLVAQINAKLSQAATYLKEANDLRIKAGLESLIYPAWKRDDDYSRLSDLLDEKFDNDEAYEEALEEAMELERAKFDKIDKHDLEREISRAGWSTSSSYC